MLPEAAENCIATDTTAGRFALKPGATKAVIEVSDLHIDAEPTVNPITADCDEPNNPRDLAITVTTNDPLALPNAGMKYIAAGTENDTSPAVEAEELPTDKDTGCPLPSPRTHLDLIEESEVQVCNAAAVEPNLTFGELCELPILAPNNETIMDPVEG